MSRGNFCARAGVWQWQWPRLSGQQSRAPSPSSRFAVHPPLLPPGLHLLPREDRTFETTAAERRCRLSRRLWRGARRGRGATGAVAPEASRRSAGGRGADLHAAAVHGKRSHFGQPPQGTDMAGAATLCSHAT
eukprot:364521-Chlamydomonas_euryale.AAC.2